MNQNKMEEFNSNIIKWYPFEKGSRILQIGANDNISRELNSICDKELSENNKFDYVLIYGYEKQPDILERSFEFLKEDGRLIIIGNNEFGINKWSKYDEVLNLEKNNFKKSTIKNIRQKLNEKFFNKINVFYVFPNYETAEIIVNEKSKIPNSYIDKYNADIYENDLRIFNENNVLKDILINDSNMLEFFTNSYFIEASKNEILSHIKSVSYNNCRKEEYRLITIIEDDEVRKVPANVKAQAHIDNMTQIINELNEENIKILDYSENGIIHSKFIDGVTVDEILNQKYNNFDEIVKILNGIKEILIKKSIKYEDCKNEIAFEKINVDKIENLHFLKSAFWDMIAKNCFFIEGKYTFFDQEWKAEYLPVEFLIYRSIINSYELVKKINVDKLLERLEIYEYKEYFQMIDNELREKIIDQDIYKEMYKKNIKGVDNIINDKKIIELCFENEKEDNRKKQEYIEQLEEDNRKKQKYIEQLEEDNRRKQEYIIALENRKRYKKHK